MDITIFIKPTANKFCIAAFSNQQIIKLIRIIFVETETECIEFLKQYGEADILFDGSIYAQTGISIREKTDLPVRIFKAKKKNGNIHDRIAAQQEWIAKNMEYNAEMKENADYSRFFGLLSDYNPANTNCDPTAADLMADAARYFRRRKDF